MDTTALKPAKVLKMIGMAVLIMISASAWVQAGSYQSKAKNMISCEGESSDTIIIVQERSRGRVLFDILKKMTFIHQGCKRLGVDSGVNRLFELKSLFVNAYQRNVFYVFAFSTVP